MDSSYLSLFIFLLITIGYFMIPSIGKIPITLEILKENDLTSYYKKNMMRLGLYFLIVLISQFLINALFLINKCGGSSGTNIGVAALLTFIPWIFIFGVVIAILIIYPGLKSAFSDVIGYFVVANASNKILSYLLVDINADETIENSNLDLEKKGIMKKSAEAILKLCGNKSILINQMNPENFLSIWEIIKPLMKNDGKIPDIIEKQSELLKLVVLRDNIGEALWYIYTAILLTSIISYNLTTRGCVKTIDQLKESHDEYLAQEEEILAQENLNNSTSMTI